MTAWTDERIPLWVSPTPGEALDSWLEAYAYRLKTNTLDFVDYLGLRGASPQKMVRRLTGHERDVLARRTGLSTEALTAMTLEPYDSSVVRIHPVSRRMLYPPAWRHYSTASRYCPACLEEDRGRWQLPWRLSWTFACTRHQLLLLDFCPRCGHPPPVASRGRYRVVPPPQTCRSWVRGPDVRCGFPLSQAPATSLPAHGLVQAAQLEVAQSVLAEHHSSAARERGQELHFLARRALRGVHSQLAKAPPLVREVLDECGGSLPELGSRQQASDAHNVAVGTAVAVVATDLQHPACEEVFTWLYGTPGRPRTQLREHPTSQLGNWAPAGPRVAARILAAYDNQLTLAARLRYRSATTAPERPTLAEDDVRRRASKLPSMLWASWTLRLLPAKTPHQARIPGIRRACATLLLIPGSSTGQHHASRLLGNAQTRSNIHALQSFIDDDHIARGLAYLAQVLDHHSVPIDYTRRRALFTGGAHELPFDEHAFRQICRRHGNQTYQPVHLKRARWHLERLLIGAEPGSGNHAPDWSHRSTYRMHPEISTFLLDQAADILKSHDIGEPVVFEPPAHWLGGLELPIAPLEFPTERLHALLQQGPSQTKAAKALGLTVHQLRLLLESRSLSVPAPPRPPKPKGGYVYRRQGPLAPDRLRDLYQRQGLQQQQIAAMVGCGVGVVRQALEEAGIPRRFRRAAGELEASISRAWLKAEYVDKGRSLADIARELDADSTSLITLRDKWGIPRHPPGHVPPPRVHPSPFADLTVKLSPAMQRISTRRNSLQALRSALLAAGYPTRRAAAIDLGIPRTSFNAHLRLLDDAAGFALFDHRTRPVKATPCGQVLLTEARHLIHLLEDHQPAASESSDELVP
ncbi:TniQ family protein [Streptomyces sp. NPDC058067]|uniref:TniQ family protein n=1 Tax=Streptomyces sp. NPDC058067 TaxID=3346324 RepID=UPI0036E2E2D7